MLRVSGVHGVIPEFRPSLFDLKERYAMSDSDLMVFHRIYGLDRVPVSDEPMVELVTRAVARLLADSGTRPEKVAWLVHAHTSQQVAVVGEAMLSQVARRLQLTSARTFGMSTNNCASTISALQTVDRVLAASGPAARAVLVTADIAFTPVLQHIPNTSVTGDAAVACLLSRESDGHAVLASRVDIYGQHARCQWEREPEHAEFEAEYPRRLASTMSLALQQAGISWQDVRWIIPHNVNVFSWKRVARCAGIPMDRIYLAQVAKIAHCFGGDIFLNWYLAEQEGRFRAGDYLLLATVGLGAVFGAAVVQYAG